MLKSLQLKNFQKHSKLTLDFCDGVNILYGKSDAGKSCIRRAIEWIVQNENIDGIRKVGTKQTSVIIKLANGKEIERVRSTSINRYIIREGKDEQVFDSIGKSIPDEVKEALTIYPIEVDGEEIYLNSQPQLGLPFLFDKSPSFRMKLFNKLTGNDVLDQLNGQFNKDILRTKRNLKEETQTFEDRLIQLKSCKVNMEKAEALHYRLKIRIKNLKELHKKYANLLELKQLREANSEYIEEVENKVKNLKSIQPNVIQQLTSKIEQFEQLLTQQKSLEKTIFGITDTQSRLKDLKPLSVDYAGLRGKIERFDTLRAIFERNCQNMTDMSKTVKKQKINSKEYDVSVANQKRLLTEMKICPTCNQEIK